MRTTILIAISALSMGAVPALAQDAMMKSGEMKMSATDMKKMKSCQAMSHDKMMKDAGCAKMMKMHPDMMSGDGMMKKDPMMKKGRLTRDVRMRRRGAASALPCSGDRDGR